MIKIKFYSLVRTHLSINEVEIKADSIIIYDLFLKTEQQIGKKFLYLLIDENKQIIPSTIILINGRNVFHLDKLNSLVECDDEISIFPPGGGG